MSKGSNRRPTNEQAYSENYDKIFSKDEKFKIPKNANIHPSCSEPFCSCVDKCLQMEPIKAGDLHK